MRMVDLRPSSEPAAPPVLSVRPSAAAEILRFTGVMVDDEDALTYDVGAERIERIRDRLAVDALERIRRVESGAKAYFAMSLIAAELPEPAGVDELLTQLERDPGTVWRLLLGHYAASKGRPEDQELGDRIAAGDEDAIATVRAWDDDELPDAHPDDHPDKVRDLLAVDPAEHGRSLADAIRAVRPVWDEVAAETMGAIERDAAHRQTQLDAGMPLAELVMNATNGYELPPDHELDQVVLLPTYWLRPWLVVARRGRTELLSSVVADEFVSLPSEAPSPALLKLFKALADEGRLKLLRRMSNGPVSLVEAMDELGVAKATAHHHLSILRQAGLVAIRGEGRSTRYVVRSDPPEVARDALASYVQPEPR